MVPARHLHCAAWNENDNLFCPLLHMYLYDISNGGRPLCIRTANGFVFNSNSCLQTLSTNQIHNDFVM